MIELAPDVERVLDQRRFEAVYLFSKKQLWRSPSGWDVLFSLNGGDRLSCEVVDSLGRVAGRMEEPTGKWLAKVLP